MMHKHGIEYADLPLCNEGRHNLAEMEDHSDHPDVQDWGDCVRINFKVDTLGAKSYHI